MVKIRHKGLVLGYSGSRDSSSDLRMRFDDDPAYKSAHQPLSGVIRQGRLNIDAVVLKRYELL